MGAVDLSVLIPTTGRRPEILSRVATRWEWLARAEGYTIEILTTSVYTWGEGCNYLMTRAKGETVALVPDDVLPCEGLYTNAKRDLDHQVMRLGRYFHENGQPLHEAMDLLEHGCSYPWSRCFMLPTETVLQLGPMIDATWYADIEYSERLTAAGWRIEARNGYWFTHLEAPRDWLTDEEEQRSRDLYDTAVRERNLTPW